MGMCRDLEETIKRPEVEEVTSMTEFNRNQILNGACLVVDVPVELYCAQGMLITTAWKSLLDRAYLRSLRCLAISGSQPNTVEYIHKQVVCMPCPAVPASPEECS